MRNPNQPHLTPRQREVLRSLMTHGAHKLVSTELGVSQRTVEAHMRAIYKAFGVGRRNIVLLVLRAEREGWLED